MNNPVFIQITFFLLAVSVLFSQDQSHKNILSNYDVESGTNEIITLTKNLEEISGLATDKNDRIFAHNDEAGIVYVFDIKKKNIIKKFHIGTKTVKKDFEGIAVVEDSIYLITSSGILYKFTESGDSGNTDYVKIKTGLSAKYNVEGLCYDSLANSLLLSCKAYPGKDFEGYRAVYEFDLNKNNLKRKPRLLIDLKLLESKYGTNNFSPSGIAIHPVNGNYFIISSHEKAIIEVSRDGRILNVKKLKAKQHPQPEGITFLTDNTMVISDEARDKKARLTIIPFNP